MSTGTPEQRLWLAKQRQAQLFHEASQYRLAKASRDNRAQNASTKPFKWTWRWLGQLSARIRALHLREELCSDPCPE
jgi:hypothetical protein